MIVNDKRWLLAVLLLSMLLFFSCSKEKNSYENLTMTKNSSKSKPIVSMAQKIEFLMKSENWKGLYDLTATDVKKQFPAEAGIAQYEQFLKKYGKIDSLAVKEIHLATTIDKVPTTITGESAILPSPVELFLPEKGPLAFVLCESKSSQTQYTCWITLVFKKENADWALFAFNMAPSEINGHKGNWFLEKAEEFSRQKEERNSFLYTWIGCLISNTRPFITSPSLEEGFKAFLKRQAPPNLPLEGIRPADVWMTEKGRFHVDYVGPYDITPFLNLEILYKTHLPNSESNEAAAERKLIFDYVSNTFPEYKNAFDGIYIGAKSPSGFTFREYFALKNQTSGKP